MADAGYQRRRSEIETYFDRTASEAWTRLTSDAPLGRIRATVRAGRERMRNVVLDLAAADDAGLSILDAGCGPGELAIEAATRCGIAAKIVGVDLSATLVDVARARALALGLGAPRLVFRTGDMLDVDGRFDAVIAMDSLIHYDPANVVEAIARLSLCAKRRIVFTFAPLNSALLAMHLVGRLLPAANRAPKIVPVRERDLVARLCADPRLRGWHVTAGPRIKSGFYISQAMRLERS
ncbi:MAG: magnesium protoporphyrin IX methyltransferase [Rhizobiales bacterium]|nr:magnesium protoporphyrin IX methyltransferase [Hyphomicrobiales bacterium]